MLGFFFFWWYCELLLQRLSGGNLWCEVLEEVCKSRQFCFLITVLFQLKRIECGRFVFGITALLPLITSAVAVLVKEQPVLGSARGQSFSSHDFMESSKQNIIQLWGAIRQPNVFLPTLFILLWQSTPHSDSAMFYFTYVRPMI